MTLALGLNQTAYNYYGQDMPFIDLMKGAHDWSGTLNQWGYPVSAPGRVGSLVPMEDVLRPYTVTKKGAGKLSWGSAGPGHTEAQWTQTLTADRAGAGGSAGSANMLAEGFNATDPLTSITVVRAEYQGLLDAGQIVNPDFAAKMKPFNRLRFMDWGHANAAIAADVPRAQLSDRSWAGVRGVPIEAMVAVANATGCNMWINLPVLVNDVDAVAIFKVVHDNLNPTLNCYAEYSNETWNQGFPQTAVVKTLAAAKWRAGTGPRWTGFRTGQLALLGRTYGIKMVGGVQTVQPGLAKDWWAGYAESGALDSDMAGWIITVYINGTLTSRQQSSYDIINNGDLNAAFANLRTGAGAGSIAGLAPIMKQQSDIAKAHNIPLFAYECNLHLNCQGFPDIPKAIAFFEKVQNDPRAGAVMDEALRAFEAAGGSLAMMFASSGPGQTIGGNFGLTRGLSDTVGLPVWQMMQRRLVAAQAPVVTPPVVTPPVVPPVVPPATIKASPEVVSAIKALYDMVTAG